MKCHPTLIVVSKNLISRLAKILRKYPKLEILQIDDDPELYPFSEESSANGVSSLENLILWREFMALGPNEEMLRKEELILEYKRKGVNDAIMLLPTSGSSGVPKLTIVTTSMLLHQVNVPKTGNLLVMYSFEPLKQNLDVLAKGGSIGVFSGLSRISDDCRLLCPTTFGATPTFWNGLYSQFQNDLDAMRKALESELSLRDKMDISDKRASDLAVTPNVDLAKKVERKALKRTKKLWDDRRVLGNRSSLLPLFLLFLHFLLLIYGPSIRCKLAIVGGASTNPKLRQWIFDVLRCIVIDGPYLSSMLISLSPFSPYI